MRETLCALREAGIQARYTRFSALDRFFRTAPSPLFTLSVSCNIIDLARLFSGLRYPGLEGVDAALSPGETDIYFTCDENGDTSAAGENFDVLRLLYDPFSDRFYDPSGIYPRLRAPAVRPRRDSGESAVPPAAEAAILISRYAYTLENAEDLARNSKTETPLSPESQRSLLSCILSGQNALEGLRSLAGSGFLDALWPELAALRGVTHSKEYHPEGGVWDHTLETFRYRKTNDLRLALALLLHDAGKPHTGSSGSRRFDRHAEIGAAIAEKFLSRLGFPQTLIQDVCFLVRNHMLPGLIKTLPTYRTESVLASPLFPLLLEVYRCDLSSTFRGPDGYYEACKVYRAFLKHSKNPYRTSGGRKIRRIKEHSAWKIFSEAEH
jgi:poly(A) polymerase